MEQDADGQMTFDFGRTGDRIQINAEKSVTLKATDGGGGASTGLYMLPVYVLNGAAIGRTGKNGGNQLGIMLSDSKLRETQIANYFSDIYPIDCAVLSANAQSCQKCCTLLSVLFCA